MVREMDVHRLQDSGKCIKVAIHSDPPPNMKVLVITAILIDIHSQSILLCCCKKCCKSTQRVRDQTHEGRGAAKAAPNETP